MAKYRNPANTRSIEYSEPFITIENDTEKNGFGSTFDVSVSFQPKPEDLPSIARDLLEPVKGQQPSSALNVERVVVHGKSDEDLIYIAWRNLEAVRIRRERSEAERAKKAKQLEADALKLYSLVLGKEKDEFYGPTVRKYWETKLEKLREEFDR